ncbi:MAG TPA: M48 family metallopeptidase [Candidatus Paceibacterota bacterium]|nr:M48 family metallopeptidase [Candidatus Paceibacterota bacterium]
MRSRWFRVRRRGRRPRSRAARELYATHKETARARIHERLAHWSVVRGASYGRVAIRDQRSRWGSCSRERNLNFNFRLAFLPVELLDYVIVHELCHLDEFNHSPDFWALVEASLPDYRLRRRALRAIPIESITSPL